MKFLVDAQLPRRLAHEINALRGDAVHMLDLPAGNRTSDAALSTQANGEGPRDGDKGPKDSDFVNSFLLRGEPAQLLFITTGNVSNNDLIQLLRAHWASLLSLFEEGNSVEFSHTALTLHM